MRINVGHNKYSNLDLQYIDTAVMEDNLILTLAERTLQQVYWKWKGREAKNEKRMASQAKHTILAGFPKASVEKEGAGRSASPRHSVIPI